MILSSENSLSCKRGSKIPKRILSKLPVSQAGPGRHKCCHCAFQRGLEDGRRGWLPSDIHKCDHDKVASYSLFKEKIHENQGGMQRHKCAVCAYAEGWNFDEESFFEPEKSEPENNGLILVEPPYFSKKEAIKKKPTFGRVWRSPKSNEAQKIGLAGEKLIMKSEKKKLREAKRMDLAKKVIHVSQEVGDGAGYDILSYDVDGSEILIEVKTTILKDKETGFFITANELECARHHRENYKIYRIYEFNPNSNSGKFFHLSVEQLEKMRLIPLQYRCEF